MLWVTNLPIPDSVGIFLSMIFVKCSLRLDFPELAMLSQHQTLSWQTWKLGVGCSMLNVSLDALGRGGLDRFPIDWGEYPMAAKPDFELGLSPIRNRGRNFQAIQ